MDEAAEDIQDPEPAPQRRRGWARAARLLLAALLITLALLLALAAAFSGRVVGLPDWVRDRIEISLNSALPEGRIELGGAIMEVRRGALPRVTLQNLTLIDAGGARIADLNAVQARLVTGGLLRGEATPARIDLTGAQITFRRSLDGRVAVSFGGAVEGSDETLSDLLDDIDALFEEPPLQSTTRINADALTITLEDARSGRIWQASNAALQLMRTDEALSIALTSELFNGTENLAELEFDLRRDRATGRSEFAAAIRDMPARDIAAQSPILSYLGVLDAPISGAVEGSLDELGLLEGMRAQLEIGEGSLRPSQQTRPIAFQSGLAAFAYDPATERLDFQNISVETEAGFVAAKGRAYLRERVEGWPNVLLMQIEVEDAKIAPGVVLEDALAITSGHADMRLRLDPFTLDLGAVHISDGTTAINAEGWIAAQDDGWSLSLGAHLDQIDPARLLTLWPADAAPGARRWIAQNVKKAKFTGIHAAVRSQPDTKPNLALDFDFSDATINYLKGHPAITTAVGHGSILNKRFALFLQEGRVVDPVAGDIVLDGSVMTIPDISLNPARAEITLETQGSLGAHLALLARDPVRLEERAGYDVNRARAEFRGRGDLGFDLLRELPAEAVDWQANGVLTNVQSDTLVPNRIFAADSLRLSASPRGISIKGDAVLDGLDFTGDWQQAFGPNSDGSSEITGIARLSGEALATFGVALPPGTLSGQTDADLRITLTPGEAPRLSLTSSLAGMVVSVPALSWSKSADREAEFRLSASLGETPKIDAVALTAPGLRAEGRVRLGPGGVFEGLELDRLRTGGWLDASVQLTSQGSNAPPRIALTSGSVDIRQLDLERGRARGARDPAPIELALDRVILADGLQLQNVQGRLSTAPSLSGTFQGRVNGGAPIEGALIPVSAGTAIRMQAADAGSVFRDAGIFKSTYSGSADVILSPTGQPGVYDGQLLVERIALRGAPPLAALIDAISVVGLLDELNGPGIVFDTVDAQFTLTPDQVRIQRASAVGPSIGVSIDGIYELASRQVDLQGVISPVYFLNGIGAILTRRGEGLFGFNFTMKGPADAPSLRVNPLSILTPGMFREIFRRPPPTATENPQ
ncbi:MAG: AsmA-like C-terminal region-containing protein [Pseudomonadota bacterium]